MNKLASTLLLIFLVQVGYSQRVGIEGSTGIISFDLINDGNSPITYIKGWAQKTEISLETNLKLKDNWAVHISPGFMFLTNWDVFGLGPRKQFDHYANLKLGFRYKLSKNIAFKTSFVSYYYLARNISMFDQRNKFFANIDVGAEVKLSKRYSLGINTPITVSPFLTARGTQLNNPVEYKVWVETIGLSTSLLYMF